MLSCVYDILSVAWRSLGKCVFTFSGRQTHSECEAPHTHADTDTEACRQLSTMATGVAAEMVQLLHGYFRLISVSPPPPPPPPHTHTHSPYCALLCSLDQHSPDDNGGWNANSEEESILHNCVYSVLLHIQLFNKETRHRGNDFTINQSLL